jgi:hypothetical protein
MCRGAWLVRNRSLTYLTVLFTVLLPLIAAGWARSYMVDELLYRVGEGRAIMISCIRGEIAIWSGPAASRGPVRYEHETTNQGYAMTASEMLSMDHTAETYWLAGFGFARTYAMAPRELGPVRCWVLPLWGVALLAGALPARVLLRQVRRSHAAIAAEAAGCRRCGAEIPPGETRCQACSFPAFIRRSVVA